MDYTGYHDFPFPPVLADGDKRLREAFFALPDDLQLSFLNGCLSYDEFRARLSTALSGTSE